MSLGLLVGIAALGVIGARAVVERRHGIGVLRAIGFTPGMVQLSFLAEMSFLAAVGIGLGLGLGLISSVELIDEMREDEPEVEFVIPWLKVILIALGAYIFSILITITRPPSRQNRPRRSPPLRIAAAARRSRERANPASTKRACHFHAPPVVPAKAGTQNQQSTPFPTPSIRHISVRNHFPHGAILTLKIRPLPWCA